MLAGVDVVEVLGKPEIPFVDTTVVLYTGVVLMKQSCFASAGPTAVGMATSLMLYPQSSSLTSCCGPEATSGALFVISRIGILVAQETGYDVLMTDPRSVGLVYGPLGKLLLSGKM